MSSLDWNEHSAIMGIATAKTKAALKRLAAKHGPDALKLALARFVHRPEGFVGLDNPWAKFFKDAPDLLCQAKADQNRWEQEQAEQDAHCRRGAAEEKARMDLLRANKPTDDDGSIEDYIGKGS